MTAELLARGKVLQEKLKYLTEQREEFNKETGGINNLHLRIYGYDLTLLGRGALVEIRALIVSEYDRLIRQLKREFEEL